MVSVPVLDDEDLELLVAYTRDPGEEMSSAVVNAFLAGDVDVNAKETQLESWIDTDALGDLDWSTARSTLLYIHIWEHPVVLTPEEVRIYDSTTSF